jgi:hypothetical protein
VSWHSTSASAAPNSGCDRVDPDTREWLERNNIPFDGLLYSDQKMKELAERVEPERVVMVLDDLVPVLEAASSIFGASVPVLRRTRYNQLTDWPQTVYNLEDAAGHVEQKINNWRSYEEQSCSARRGAGV